MTEVLTTPGKNIDPGLEAYYQSTADLLAIFWQFHKERLVRNNLFYAYSADGQEFSVKGLLDNHSVNAKPLEMIHEFDEAVKRSMVNSWFQFVGGVGGGIYPHDFFYWKITVPDYSKRFMGEYTRELYERTWGLGVLYSQTGRGSDFYLHKTVNSGMNTGIIGTSFLSALLADSFHYVHPVKLAKTKLNKLNGALTELGAQVPELPKVDHTERVQDPTYEYPLLHATRILDPERLHELGYGEAIGCPARMRPSEETRTYLRDECGVEVKGSVLQEFAVRHHQEFESRVREPYQLLSLGERAQHTSLNSWLLMDGEVWEAVKTAGKGSSGCPFSGGK